MVARSPLRSLSLSRMSALTVLVGAPYSVSMSPVLKCVHSHELLAVLYFEAEGEALKSAA